MSLSLSIYIYVYLYLHIYGGMNSYSVLLEQWASSSESWYLVLDKAFMVPKILILRLLSLIKCCSFWRTLSCDSVCGQSCNTRDVWNYYSMGKPTNTPSGNRWMSYHEQCSMFLGNVFFRSAGHRPPVKILNLGRKWSSRKKFVRHGFLSRSIRSKK